MLEPKDLNIKEMTGVFQLKPIPALKAIKLDKKIMTLLVPVIGGLKDVSLDAGIDMSTVARGLSEALNDLDDKDTEQLIIDLLYGVVYVKSGEPPMELNEGTINNVFNGCFEKLYDLIFEVMKYNKFSPFRLAAGGKKIPGMFGLLSMKKEEKSTKKDLVKSEN
jgi:hypothetical protein